MSAGTYAGAPKSGANENHDDIPANTWRRRLLALSPAVAVLLAAGAVISATDPFSRLNNKVPGVSDNAFPISYQSVMEEPLSSQIEVQGTLTYASGNNSLSSIVVVLPSGTATSAVTQSRQQVSSAAEVLAADRLALASTVQAGTGSVAQAEQVVATAQATLGSDERALGIGGRTGSETTSQARLEVASAGQALNEDKALVSIVNQSNSELLSQATAEVATARSALVAQRAALQSVAQANSEALAQAQHQLTAAQSTLATSTASLDNATQANSEALAQAQQAVATAQATTLSDRAALTAARQSNTDSLQQAETQVATARSALASDEPTLAIDKAILSADEQKQAADCRVGATLASGRDPGPTSPTSVPGACATDTSRVATDQSTVTDEDQKVATDRVALTTAQQDVASTRAHNTQLSQQAQSQVVAAQTALTTAQQDVASTRTHNTQLSQQAQSQVVATQTALTTAQQDVASTRTHNTQLSQQAQSQVVAAQTALTTAQQDVASTRTHNAQTAQQALAKVASDEVGAASAEDSAASTRSNNALSAEQSEAKVTADQAALSSAEENVSSTNIHDRQLTQQAQAEVDGADLALSQARANLATAASTASIEDESSTYTALPQIGQVLRRGDALFAVSGRSVVLLYGPRQPWRAFIPGMSPGPDVAELNANLFALGYGGSPGRDFSAATVAAVKRFQTARGLAPTGQLALGSVLFEPAAFRVSAVTPTVGSSVTAGQAVLDGTLMARQVQIALGTSEQSHMGVGDKVSIVMPDNSTTPGVVSYVGTVAQLPSNNNGPSAPTVNVYVSPLDPSATGKLDQLPVNVWVTTASVPSALVVPVDALLALARGGYALEMAGSDGSHHLVAVTLGLFDDADGLVQVSGPGVQEGKRVVVPST